MSTARPLDRPLSRTVRPAHSASDLDALARWMDSAFTVPGTRFRFGLDALLGLLPGVGDVTAAAASLYILSRAQSLGASRATMVRMSLNLLLDLAIGAIPIVGDAFDAYWKANLRNVELLRRHARASGTEAGRLRRGDRAFVVVVFVLACSAIAASLVGAMYTLAFLVSAISNAWR
jgi:hypothetical protein